MVLSHVVAQQSLAISVVFSPRYSQYSNQFAVLMYWQGWYDADNNPAAALLWLAAAYLLIWGFLRLGVSNQDAYDFEGTMRSKIIGLFKM